MHAAEADRESPDYHDQVTIHLVSPLIVDETSPGSAQGSVAAELWACQTERCQFSLGAESDHGTSDNEGQVEAHGATMSAETSYSWMHVVDSEDAQQGMSEEHEQGDWSEGIKEGEMAAVSLALVITVLFELGNKPISLGVISVGTLCIIPIVEFTFTAVIVQLTLLFVDILNGTDIGSAYSCQNTHA